MPKLILCCGDRNWDDYQFILDMLRTLPEDSRIIEGEARGADLLSSKAACELGFNVTRVPANWDKYSKRAGPIRNSEMLDLSPSQVWAFHDDLENSKGTKDCVNKAKARGIDTIVFTHKGSYRYV